MTRRDFIWIADQIAKMIASGHVSNQSEYIDAFCAAFKETHENFDEVKFRRHVDRELSGVFMGRFEKK